MTGKIAQLPPVVPQYAGGPVPIEQRVRVCMDAMTAGLWSAAKAQELATEWGVAVNTVVQSACEASRRIEYVTKEGGISWTALITAGVQAIAVDAITAKDRQSALRAFDQLAKIHGVYAPARVAVSEDIASLTDEQLEAKRVEILAALTKGDGT